MMEKITLSFRPAEPRDASVICEQRNNGDRRFLKNPSLMSIGETETWLENLGPNSKRFMVMRDCEMPYSHLDAKNYYIGIIRIDHIDYHNRNCEIGLDIFDHCKGMGLAAPIYNWLLNYLFNDLNMHSVYLEVLETNERAKHIYQKLGFVLDGILRERIYRDGKYIDYLMFSLLKSEYNKRKNSEQTCTSNG